MTFDRALLSLVLLSPIASMADDAAPPAKPVVEAQRPADSAAVPDTASEAGLKPLNKQETVLIDVAKKRLILKTQVCLRAGPLEMLMCKAQTKEHESILAIKSDAYVIHAGLLALGLDAGTPVRYEPKFQAPTGPRIQITLSWRDAEGKTHSVPAQSWIRRAIYRYYSSPLDKLPQGFTLPKESELRYDDMNHELLWFGPMTADQKQELLGLSQDEQYRQGIEQFFDQSQSREMQAEWVFAGSGFYINGDGSKYYQAEDGNVVCVANFGDALLDITIPSSANNDGLQFEAWTERIPPLGTPVEVTFTPAPAKKPETSAKSPTTPDAAPTPSPSQP